MAPLHSQGIAQVGACGKTPTSPHNRRLVSTLKPSAFALSDDLGHKDDPALIAPDERHFA